MALRLKWTASIIIVLVFVDMTDGMKKILNRMKSKKSKKLENQEICVSRPWDIHSFRRGQFKRVQRPTESLESLTSLDTAVAIGKEVRCNDAYYMLTYLHLTFPWDHWYPITMENLLLEINEKYLEWARKMLATTFNVAQNDNEMDVAWLFYLYVKRIEVHVSYAKDPNKIFLHHFQKAHHGMYKVLLCSMYENDCTMFDPVTGKERKFKEYVAALDWSRFTHSYSFDNKDMVLTLLEKHWVDLCENSSMGCYQKEEGTSDPVPGVISEKHLTLELLYLNDVFEDSRGITLLTEFGVFKDGQRLIEYLKERLLEIKRVNTPFEQYVLLLVDFHEHVQRALETMMLRIYYDFLEKLKVLNKDLREEHVIQFSKPYNDWCEFLYLPKDDAGFCMEDLQQSWNSDDSISEIILLSTQERVFDKVKENDERSKVPSFNHQSIDKNYIDKSWVMRIADEYVIPHEPSFRKSLEDLPNDHIQTAIFCAKVLVGYVKKIFDHIHFKAIQSLVKLRTSEHFNRYPGYFQNFQPGITSREFRMRTFKVCGTEAIKF